MISRPFTYHEHSQEADDHEAAEDGENINGSLLVKLLLVFSNSVQYDQDTSTEHHSNGREAEEDPCWNKHYLWWRGRERDQRVGHQWFSGDALHVCDGLHQWKREG